MNPFKVYGEEAMKLLMEKIHEKTGRDFCITLDYYYSSQTPYTRPLSVLTAEDIFQSAFELPLSEIPIWIHKKGFPGSIEVGYYTNEVYTKIFKETIKFRLEQGK